MINIREYHKALKDYNIEENKALLKYKKGYIIYSVMYIKGPNVLKK